jgi:general L-amino acid transport system permease protein
MLTLLAIAFLYVVLRGLLTWAVQTANWTPISSSLKLIAVGQYPPDQVWRIATIVSVATLLFGFSWAVWGGTVRTFALALAGAFVVLALLPLSFSNLGFETRIWFLLNPLLIWLGYLVGRLGVRPRGALLGWLLALILAYFLLMGVEGLIWLPPVDTGLWGGLLLTFLLAIVGIGASFPIGVLLALGRQSKLPVLKGFCVLFIEMVRGVPLVTILFMASIILPLFLPEGVRIDRVLRAMLGMTLFAAAYMAENVRGGLQAIPNGQYEAAKAVGLNGFQTMALIVLPQALRLVIPAIVGQFIALFMDTTLALIVGLLELLAIGKAVLDSNADWRLLTMEMFLFVAAVFWVFNFSMSYASRRLEAALGVGER